MALLEIFSGLGQGASSSLDNIAKLLVERALEKTRHRSAIAQLQEGASLRTGEDIQKQQRSIEIARGLLGGQPVTPPPNTSPTPFGLSKQVESLIPLAQRQNIQLEAGPTGVGLKTPTTTPLTPEQQAFANMTPEEQKLALLIKNLPADVLFTLIPQIQKALGVTPPPVPQPPGVVEATPTAPPPSGTVPPSPRTVPPQQSIESFRQRLLQTGVPEVAISEILRLVGQGQLEMSEVTELLDRGVTISQILSELQRKGGLSQNKTPLRKPSIPFASTGFNPPLQ